MQGSASLWLNIPLQSALIQPHCPRLPPAAAGVPSGLCCHPLPEARTGSTVIPSITHTPGGITPRSLQKPPDRAVDGQTELLCPSAKGVQPPRSTFNVLLPPGWLLPFTELEVQYNICD